MRVCGRDDQQGQVAGAFLAEKFGDKNDRHHRRQERLRQGPRRRDPQVHERRRARRKSSTTSYNAGEKDYSALVSKLKDANIDVLYVGGYHPEAGLIVRQMRDQGMKTILVSGDALVTDEYWQITGDAGEGTLMTFSPDPRKNPATPPRGQGVQPTRASIRKATSSTPTPRSRPGRRRSTTAGSTDFDPVVAALSKGTFETVLGELQLRRQG